MPESNEPNSISRLPKWPEGAGELPADSRPRQRSRWIYVFVILGAILALLRWVKPIAMGLDAGADAVKLIAYACGEAVAGALIGAVIGWLVDSYLEERSERQTFQERP
jgi:hypothetical protein